MIKKLSAIFFLGAAVLAGTAPVAQAAGYAYGSIAVSPGSDQAVLEYRTLDSAQTQICDIAAFACDPDADPASSTPAVGVPGVVFTPDMSRAVVRTASVLALLDLKANTISAIVPRAADDRFFAFPEISPDGRFLAYYGPATQSNPVRHFRLVDFLIKKTYVLTEQVNYWDLLSEENMLFQFSPDSKFLLYKDDRGGQPTLYKVDLAALSGNTFQGARLFTRDYSVSDFMLVDQRTLLYLANRENPMRFDLYAYDLAANNLRLVVASVSYHPPLRRAGNLVFLNRLVSWGSEVIAYDIVSGAVKTLPRPKGSLAELQAGTDLVLPNGVHGALFLPDNFNPQAPHELVIWLHGGPYRQASLIYHPYPSYGVYDWMLEGLRASGKIVLKLDYHGSYGYGRPFAESIQGNVGVKDVEDVLGAQGALKQKYNIAETHLMGVSYGGYLALRTLVERPAAFAGAISVNGVSDWLGLVNRDPNTIFAADFGGPLTEANKAFYDRASILAKTPELTNQEVVLIHSRNDGTISFSQSAVFADILESAGKNVQFTEIPDDGHVLTKQASAELVCETVFEAVGATAGERCDL